MVGRQITSMVHYTRRRRKAHSENSQVRSGVPRSHVARTPPRLHASRLPVSRQRDRRCVLTRARQNVISTKCRRTCSPFSRSRPNTGEIGWSYVRTFVPQYICTAAPGAIYFISVPHGFRCSTIIIVSPRINSIMLSLFSQCN